MQKTTGIITSDFKNSTKRKNYGFETYIARYRNGNYYKIFIDRNDDRRQVITFTEEEAKEFARQLNTLIDLKL